MNSNYDIQDLYCDMQKKPLMRMRKLMELLGNPQKDLKFVHVAGTNGKGSTCAIIANALMLSGYKTGLFTSPFLQKFNERIRIDGRCIEDEDLLDISFAVREKAKLMADFPTEFELMTAIGFLYFKKYRCDIVVLEVGIGGIADATNVIDNSEISVITAIGLDHTEKLGGTLWEIAQKKAGIIKPYQHVVVYSQSDEILDVIREECSFKQAEMTVVDFQNSIAESCSLTGQKFSFYGYDNLEMSLLGKNQIKNACTAITALEKLSQGNWKISKKNIKEAVRRTLWAGRFEIIRKSPYFLLDCGHNQHCMKSLRENLQLYFPDKKPVILTNVMKDKDYDSMYKEIKDIACCFVVANCEYQRFLSADSLARHLDRYGKRVYRTKNIMEAVRTACSLAEEKDTFVVATGSVYICGDIRAYMTQNDSVPIIKAE